MNRVPNMNSKRALVSVLVGSLLVLCLVLDARAQCTKDTDCKGDRICSRGECVDPLPGGRGSYSDRRSRDSVDSDEEDWTDNEPMRTPRYPRPATMCVTAAGSCRLMNMVPVGDYCVCFGPYGQIPGVAR